MDERGLTADVVTLHTPLVMLATSVALIIAAIAFAAIKNKSFAVRGWVAVLWFTGAVVVAYAGGARILGVHGFDAQAISVFP